jgi:hypothetical protein
MVRAMQNKWFHFAVLSLSALIFLKLQFFLGGARTASTVGGLLSVVYIYIFYRPHFYRIGAVAFLSSIYALLGGIICQQDDLISDAGRLVSSSVVCAASYYFARNVFSKDVNLSRLVVIIIVGVAIVTSIVDAYFRFYEPGYASVSSTGVDTSLSRSYGLSEENFKTYKFGSIMFYDANYVAIYLFSVLFLLLANFHINPKNYLESIVLLILLIASTFSRVIWIFSGIVLLLFFMGGVGARLFGAQRWLVLLVISSFSVYWLAGAFVDIYDYVQNDASGASKIEVIQVIGSAFDSIDLENIFGYGFTRGWYIYSFDVGSFAHEHVAILMGQIGLLGTVAYAFIFFYISFLSAGLGLLYGVCLFLFGFSLIDPWDPVPFFVMGAIAGERARSIMQLSMSR